MSNPLQTGNKLLHGAEWMAENAYIPPGLHRLLAAGGLAVGLWGGRSFMDIVVARDHTTGKEITRDQVPQLFRPLHGTMAYNQYSDQASDRWKSVVDKFVPAITGGLMAYYGGKHFFHGTAPSFLGGAPLHPLSSAARKQLAALQEGLSSAKISSHTMEVVIGSAQSDYLRKVASATYGAGATIGTDKAGGIILGNHNMWADSFAVGANIKPRLPGSRLPVIGKAIHWMNSSLFGNYSTASVGAPRAMRAALSWAQGNIFKHDTLEWLSPEMLRKWATDGLQGYPHVSEAQIENVANHMREVITNAHRKIRGNLTGILPDVKIPDLYKELEGDLQKPGLINQGMDRLLDNAGIDLAKLKLDNNGIFTAYARMFGSAKREQPARTAYKNYLNTSGFRNATTFDDAAPKLTKQQAGILWGLAAGTTGTIVTLGSYAAGRINRRASRTLDETGKPVIETSDYTAHGAPTKNENIVSWINGTPLNMAEWASRMVIVPPSMHRLMSAGYLSAALYGGMKVADAMTGRKLSRIRGSLETSLLTRKQITPILRPLHNLMHYTPGSSALTDRWRMAAHHLIPVAFGALGTYSGSALYFKDRAKKLDTPHTLEDYADRISMEQSKPYAGLTAITSIFNTGSGIHLLPVFNYSSNLQSRYVMGAGLQVATPGLGKWWSGNEGLTPWGVKKTLAYVGNMLGQNPSARPRELPALVHSVLAKLYPDMPETELLLKKREFLHELHAVRDSYFVDGQVPPQKREAFATHMNELITGQGFENLLTAAGFDITQANLAHNGVSGAIANALGKRATVHKLEAEYKNSFAERIAKDKVDNPRSYLQKLADHSGEAKPSANDNKPASFADKLREEQASATVELG